MKQVHFPFPGARQSMLASGMKEAMDLGLIRAVGVCNYNASQMESIQRELASAGIPLASNQVASLTSHPRNLPPKLTTVHRACPPPTARCSLRDAPQ